MNRRDVLKAMCVALALPIKFNNDEVVVYHNPDAGEILIRGTLSDEGKNIIPHKIVISKRTPGNSILYIPYIKNLKGVHGWYVIGKQVGVTGIWIN